MTYWDSESSWNRKQSKEQYLALDRNFHRSSGVIVSFLLKFQVRILCKAPVQANILYKIEHTIMNHLYYTFPNYFSSKDWRGIILKQFYLLYKQTLWGLQHLPSQGTTTDFHYFLLKPVWFAIKKKSSWSVLSPQLTTRWKSFSVRCLLIRKSTNKKTKTASLQEDVSEEAKEDSHPFSNLLWKPHQF